MNEVDYYEAIKICEQALDLINIKDFLIKDKELHEIITNIDDYVALHQNDICKELYNFMEQYKNIFGYKDWPLEIFNYMTSDEFMDYCQKRFPDIKWRNEVIEHNYVC